MIATHVLQIFAASILLATLLEVAAIMIRIELWTARRTSPDETRVERLERHHRLVRGSQIVLAYIALATLVATIGLSLIDQQ